MTHRTPAGFPVKRFILLAFVISGLWLAAAQQPPSAQPLAAVAPPSAAPKDLLNLEEDRFPALRENANQLMANYEKIHDESMASVESLLKPKQRCQIGRIGGLLDRTIDVLRQWQVVEMTYWMKWTEVEQERVTGQQKSLAGMETDLDRVKALIATETKDHDQLLRTKATLEGGKRTQAIRDDIDALVLDIRDSETRLANAQKNYENLSVTVNNMNASLTTRLVDMRQMRNRVEAYGFERKSFYEGKRKEAQEVCNLKQPTTRTPLPKTPKP